MARGGTPSGDYKSTVWNFHSERYLCPNCKRKGLRENRHGYCCEYGRFGCGHSFYTDVKLEIVKQYNPQIR